MLFNSLTFFYFFVATLTVHGLLPKRARKRFLLACGFVFYMSWSVGYVLLLVGTAAVDYLVARKMGALPDRRRRRPWLMVSVLFSLGSLGFFKYTNMALRTLGSLAALAGLHLHPPAYDIVLPLGISFYTFETLSYAIDVYRGALTPTRSFLEYLSFLMFFPKLIAGPIVRAAELLPQLAGERACTAEDVRLGVNLLALGYLKKVLLADNFAPFVERVFAHPSAHNRWVCLVAAYGYSMQVYFDFSAYSDIASGCARLLGFELPQNFDKPYLAVSIADFWRRWHKTLSRWLRDYLYIPLGGNHGSRLATYRNLFVTMLIGGLWHGARWTFVFWGALNGVFLLVERAWHDLRGTQPKPESQMGLGERLWRRAIVFHLITFTRVFFRAPSWAAALELLGTIAAPQRRAAEAQVGLFLLPLAIVGFVLLSPLRRRLLAVEPRGANVFGYALALLALLVFGATQAEFIYFQF
jgi:D-alanyl-lipoteichoic acid acyltransferase DltB (MBOAT superfamily)